MDFSDVLIIVLHAYFLLMNFTIERCYCHSPLARGDDRFLIQETIDFTQKYNPLFLARPEWLRIATCMSAYGLSVGYIFIVLVALTGSWARFRLPVAFFLGAKFNAVLFYHVVEFTSATPPPDPVPYFAAEGPYVVAIALSLVKIMFAKQPAKRPSAKQHRD